MIFITVGTQIPFDRLLRMVDEIAPQLQGEEIIAQCCQATYEPRHFRTVQFINPSEFNRIVAEARVVIAHAGIGTILTAMQQQKTLVVVPRQAALHEHRNDHQLATAQNLAHDYDVAVAHNAAELLEAVRRAPVPKPLASHPARSLIAAIRRVIGG
jgi:UDP-N-acetylglucosamine transferase subunit ALG13